MKHPDSKIFDDLARMAGGAMNVMSGLREQVASDIKARVEEMAANMDLVPREDFDRLAAQVAELQKKLEALSGNPAAAATTKKTEAAPKKAAAKKTAVKKTAAKKSGKKKS